MKMAKGTWQFFMCEARISNDLELKYTPSGAAVLSFSAATNDAYKAKDGNTVETAEFHRFVAWNKTAEMIAQYFKKGDRIRIQGKLETRKWQDKNQADHYTTEIKVDRWDFVDSKKDSGQQHTTSTETVPPPSEPPLPEPSEDSLPF
jgi:single-strand DNA-binding protein